MSTTPGGTGPGDRPYTRPDPATRRSYARPEPPPVRPSSETKPAYKTTEFIAYVAILAGLFISASTITGGGSHHDIFSAPVVWFYAVILTLGYMLSRGIAKSGTKHFHDDPGSGNDSKGAT
jgi:hypothetical protein